MMRSDRLNELKRSLEEAVSKEDYESAATIRDEIRNLESEV
jgi:protein-arginine kinase activator protein McsA